MAAPVCNTDPSLEICLNRPKKQEQKEQRQYTPTRVGLKTFFFACSFAWVRSNALMANSAGVRCPLSIPCLSCCVFVILCACGVQSRQKAAETRQTLLSGIKLAGTTLGSGAAEFLGNRQVSHQHVFRRILPLSSKNLIGYQQHLTEANAWKMG